MAQIRVMESQVNIKSSAERFYKTYCTQQNKLPNICPNQVKHIQLVKGDWNSIGSVKKWTFVPVDDSCPETSSVLTIALDEKNKSITLKVIDGDVMKHYSFYRFTVQVTGMCNEEKGSSVKTTIEYEKLNSSAPEPTKYLEYGALLFKTIDAYLLKNNE